MSLEEVRRKFAMYEGVEGRDEKIESKDVPVVQTLVECFEDYGAGNLPQDRVGSLDYKLSDIQPFVDVISEVEVTNNLLGAYISALINARAQPGDHLELDLRDVSVSLIETKVENMYLSIKTKIKSPLVVRAETITGTLSVDDASADGHPVMKGIRWLGELFDIESRGMLISTKGSKVDVVGRGIKVIHAEKDGNISYNARSALTVNQKSRRALLSGFALIGGSFLGGLIIFTHQYVEENKMQQPIEEMAAVDLKKGDLVEILRPEDRKGLQCGVLEMMDEDGNYKVRCFGNGRLVVPKDAYPWVGRLETIDLEANEMDIRPIGKTLERLRK